MLDFWHGTYTATLREKNTRWTYSRPVCTITCFLDISGSRFTKKTGCLYNDVIVSTRFVCNTDYFNCATKIDKHFMLTRGTLNKVQLLSLSSDTKCSFHISLSDCAKEYFPATFSEGEQFIEYIYSAIVKRILNCDHQGIRKNYFTFMWIVSRKLWFLVWLQRCTFPPPTVSYDIMYEIIHYPVTRELFQFCWNMISISWQHTTIELTLTRNFQFSGIKQCCCGENCKVDRPRN